MTEKTDFPLVLPVTCLLSNGQDDSVSSFQLQTISRHLVLKTSNERNRSPMQSAPCLGGLCACIVLPVNYLHYWKCPLTSGPGFCLSPAGRKAVFSFQQWPNKCHIAMASRAALFG